MKALSIKQPWANLIAEGMKTIETRVWSTSHRGKILIVSSKKPVIQLAGYALAVANLIDCRPMTREDEENAQCEVYVNAYSWILTDITKIQPFPVKGQLGLYEVDIERFFFE